MVTASIDTLSGAPPDAPEPPVMPWWSWAVAAVVIFAAAFGGVLFVPSESNVALWWPAAGLSVTFVLLQPRSRWPAALSLVFVVTALANGIAGRSIGVSIGFGIGNALEAAVVVAILRWGGRDPRLQNLNAGLRFALAVLLGAAAAAVAAGMNAELLQGGDFWSTAGVVVASNAVAVALIAPFALLPPPLPKPSRRIELAMQAIVLLAVLGVVFLPGASLPLVFLPFPYIAWAALRFPIRVVLAETLAASLLVLLLSLAGVGPFSAPGLPVADATGALQSFIITLVALAVILSTAQYELLAVTRRLQESSRLLSGSLIEAGMGLVIAQERDGQTRVIWCNSAAGGMLGSDLRPGAVWIGPFREGARRALQGGERQTIEADGRTVMLAANALDDEQQRFSVQMGDVTEMLEARRAKVEASTEREATERIRAELERQRDDFLATTSHELRTPITSIVGYAELLSEHDDMSEQHRSWLTIISRNAHRLSELVEDLLTLSRGTRQRGKPQSQRIDCRELFEELTGNLRVITDSKGLRIETDACDASVLAARHDALRALSNLLVNAMKFARPGDSIRLSAVDDGDWVRLAVADTGPGMTDDEIAQAFQRFYRSPSAELGNVPGTGLGLAIVAELARRNGGAVELRRNEHSGITAELRLPSAG